MGYGTEQPLRLCLAQTGPSGYRRAASDGSRSSVTIAPSASRSGTADSISSLKHILKISPATRLARRGIYDGIPGILSEAKHHPRFHSRTLVRPSLCQSTHEGSAYASVPPSRIRTSRTREGDCRSGRTLRAPVARGIVPRLPRQEPEPRSYADATAFAASLAPTLMVSIVVFQAGDGTHSAMPADEFDGDEEMVKLELDPWS